MIYDILLNSVDNDIKDDIIKFSKINKIKDLKEYNKNFISHYNIDKLLNKEIISVSVKYNLKLDDNIINIIKKKTYTDILNEEFKDNFVKLNYIEDKRKTLEIDLMELTSKKISNNIISSIKKIKIHLIKDNFYYIRKCLNKLKLENLENLFCVYFDNKIISLNSFLNITEDYINSIDRDDYYEEFLFNNFKLINPVINIKKYKEIITDLKFENYNLESYTKNKTFSEHYNENKNLNLKEIWENEFHNEENLGKKFLYFRDEFKNSKEKFINFAKNKNTKDIELLFYYLYRQNVEDKFFNIKEINCFLNKYKFNFENWNYKNFKNSLIEYENYLNDKAKKRCENYYGEIWEILHDNHKNNEQEIFYYNDDELNNNDINKGQYFISTENDYEIIEI